MIDNGVARYNSADQDLVEHCYSSEVDPLHLWPYKLLFEDMNKSIRDEFFHFSTYYRCGDVQVVQRLF